MNKKWEDFTINKFYMSKDKKYREKILKNSHSLDYYRTNRIHMQIETINYYLY